MFGIGEAPFSISSSPTQRGVFELGIRKVGMLTDVMSRYQVGHKLGIRGPFGNGIDVEKFKGKDVLIVAGGIGLVPMRSMINYVIDNRDDFGRLIICYGSRSDKELLFVDELKQWTDDPRIEYHVTVDHGSPEWTGKTGVITTLIPTLDLDLPQHRDLRVRPAGDVPVRAAGAEIEGTARGQHLHVPGTAHEMRRWANAATARSTILTFARTVRCTTILTSKPCRRLCDGPETPRCRFSISQAVRAASSTS